MNFAVFRLRILLGNEAMTLMSCQGAQGGLDHYNRIKFSDSRAGVGARPRKQRGFQGRGLVTVTITGICCILLSTYCGQMLIDR